MARKWDKQRVLAAIRRCHEQGRSLTTVWRDNNSLYQAGWRYFGGWHQALAAAGIEPPEPKWNKERVLTAIRSRHQQGLSLESVCREDTIL